MEDPPTTPGSVVANPLPDLVLRPGTRIRVGWRKGRVEDVRGGWVRPYEVRVRWDGEGVPQYLVFTTLERDFRGGRLRVLEEDEGGST